MYFEIIDSLKRGNVMVESFRRQDMNAEQQLADFMDSYFYSKYSADTNDAVRFNRVTDPELQLNGVDVCVEYNNSKYYIDEKATLYYCNLMIPTFAFELDSIQKGYSVPIEGWFLNDNLKTDYYMLIWPNVKCEKKESNLFVRKDIRYLRKNDFTIIEAMLVDKKDIRAYVERNGFNKELLFEYAQRYRKMNEMKNTSESKEIFPGGKLFYSGHLAEKPVNIVINKEALKNLAKNIYLISADGYAKIKG